MIGEPWWRQPWRFVFAVMFAASLFYAESQHIELPGWLAVAAFVLVLPVQELSGTAIAALWRLAHRRWRLRDFPRATARFAR